MKAYVGIDPGKDGGISVIRDDGIILCVAYEDKLYVDIIRSCTQCDSVKVCLEKVNAMPGQGVTSMFSFGKSAGFLEGVLQSFEIPYQLIPPQRWKKEFGLNSDKQLSIDVCRKLFPHVSLLRTPQCKKPHDGMAESLLMAEYARRNL